MIILTEEEKEILSTALSAARIYYQEQGIKWREEEIKELDQLINRAGEIKIEFKKEGITELGMKHVQEILQRRKGKARKRSRVIQFPTPK